jgi:hypothetical protein
MGVDVEQPRNQVIAFAVDGFVAGRDGGAGAGNALDPVTADQHRGVFDDAVFIAVEDVAVDQSEGIGAEFAGKKRHGHRRRQEECESRCRHGLGPGQQQHERILWIRPGSTANDSNAFADRVFREDLSGANEFGKHTAFRDVPVQNTFPE